MYPCSLSILIYWVPGLISLWRPLKVWPANIAALYNFLRTRGPVGGRGGTLIRFPALLIAEIWIWVFFGASVFTCFYTQIRRTMVCMCWLGKPVGVYILNEKTWSRCLIDLKLKWLLLTTFIFVWRVPTCQHFKPNLFLWYYYDLVSWV